MSSDDNAQMPFLEHLEEFTGCLKRTILGILVMAILSFVWASELFALLTEPLKVYFDGAQLIGTGPAEAFIVKLKVSAFSGLLLASPYSFFQLWKFVSPGLHKNERRLAIPFVFMSTFCFLVGVSFCFKLIFPFAFQFFVEEFRSIGVTPTIRIGEYLSFAVRLVLVFGVVFELPVLSFFLARFGLLTHTWLIEKARYAVVIVFIAAAILTPPDIVTQLLLGFPLIVLYGMCIGIAYLAHPEATSKASDEVASG